MSRSANLICNRVTYLVNPSVLVDKPVTATYAEAVELGALAKSKNLVLYPYQNRRWDSDFLALRRLLSEPPSSPVYLGELVEFESQYVKIFGWRMYAHTNSCIAVTTDIAMN